MGFFETIKELGSATTSKGDAQIVELGTLNKFDSVQRKDNAVLADGTWIPIKEKSQDKQITLNWVVLSYMHKSGERRITCGERTINEGWEVLK